MLKYILVFAINVFLITAAQCQKTDTTITYYRYLSNSIKPVSTRDSADFIRMTLPPDPGDSLINVKEFYQNGNIKFIGKAEPTYVTINSFRKLAFILSGDGIIFFPNGKKQNIAHYVKAKKEGNEYLYYPNGTLYCIIKHPGGYLASPKNWECYDDKGNMICKDGKGEWVLYDKDFNVLIRGPVKNGLFEGSWVGQTTDKEPVKYVYKYSEGIFMSGIGYDKTGAAYPFKQDIEPANYNHENIIYFVRLLREYLKLPLDTSGRKMSLDTAHISFVIEKDGTLTSAEIVGNKNPQLTEALKAALKKCTYWNPRRYYGIPLRTQITLPYKELGMVQGNNYHREILYKEHIIGY